MRVVYNGRICDIKELVGKRASLKGLGITGVLDVVMFNGEYYPVVKRATRSKEPIYKIKSHYTETTPIEFDWDTLKWSVGRGIECDYCWLYVEGKRVYPHVSEVEFNEIVDCIEHLVKVGGMRGFVSNYSKLVVYIKEASKIVEETLKAR
ncbi:MAG: hypothetical protein ACTSPB_16630 [Candidatus Thorarchaeota archaeon]